MGNLTACKKKLKDQLSASDWRLLDTRTRELRATGLAPSEAAKKAVREAYYAELDAESAREAEAEHAAIMKALASRDSASAMQRMREHFANGLEAAA